MTFSIDKFKPMGQWVYLKFEEAQSTATGIYWREEDYKANGDIKDTLNEDWDVGVVVAKGDKTVQVEIGDRVIFGKLYGDFLTLLDNKRYIKILEESIISKIPTGVEIRPGQGIDHAKKMADGEDRWKIKF